MTVPVMFSFLTPTDKFAFTWRGFYRDQKETIAGSVQVADCLPTLPLGFLEAKMLPWTPAALLGPQQKID